MWCLQGTPLAGSRYTGTLSGDEQSVQTQRKQLLDQQAKGELNDGEQCEYVGLLLRMTTGRVGGPADSSAALLGNYKQEAWRPLLQPAPHACIRCMCQTGIGRV